LTCELLIWVSGVNRLTRTWYRHRSTGLLARNRWQATSFVSRLHLPALARPPWRSTAAVLRIRKGRANRLGLGDESVLNPFFFWICFWFPGNRVRKNAARADMDQPPFVFAG
jgi:hypothetical protein